MTGNHVAKENQMTTLAPNLPPLPARFKKLPVDHRGFPVPKFVANIDGCWDFRVVKPGWPAECHNKSLCWLCGERLGRFRCFVIGPMCAINRVSSELPSHLECAHFAVRACPFMVFPNRKRDDSGLPEEAASPAGFMIPRNPGVTCLWVTEHYRPFRAGNGWLFQIGDPTSVEWWARGREATRAEVDESIRTGLPALQSMAEEEGPAAVEKLRRMTDISKAFLPVELRA